MDKLTIDELEILTPDELGWILITEVVKAPPNYQYIQDILDVGGPIDFRTKSGWTALHHAAWWGKIGAVKFLISKGAEVNARTNDGRTAWDIATDKTRILSHPELEPK